MTNVTPIRRERPHDRREREVEAAMREIEAVERIAPVLFQEPPRGRVY